MNPHQVWQAALSELQASLPVATFETWVKNTLAQDFTGESFTIAAPNTFAKEWLDNRIRGKIEHSLQHIIGRPVTLQVVVERYGNAPESARAPARKRASASPMQTTLIGAPADADDDVESRLANEIEAPLTALGRAWKKPPSSLNVPEDDDTVQSIDPPPATPGGRSRGRLAEKSTRNTAFVEPNGYHDVATPRSRNGSAAPVSRRYPGGASWQPDSRWTFENFIIGPSNRFAHAASRAVADAPATNYNPLFIHGGVGLGKTHLLQAIARATHQSGLTVRYVTCEQFTNDMIDAIQRRQNDDFRAAYRSNDILLIDDIQFLAGKEATQEEFFHTFNHFHGARRQIVISSDRPPRAIATLEQRLTSRFEWGLIVDIQPPDIETRTAILRDRASHMRPIVPDDVLNVLAERVSRNVRELEGALTTVAAYAHLNHLPLTVETANRALTEATAGRPRPVQPAAVVAVVSKYYQVEAKLLRGKQRDRAIVVPRQVAMYLMREETTASLLEIGRELGGRDHSTVLHGWEKIKTEADTDDKLRRDILALRERLLSEMYDS